MTEMTPTTTSMRTAIMLAVVGMHGYGYHQCCTEITVPKYFLVVGNCRHRNDSVFDDRDLLLTQTTESQHGRRPPTPPLLPLPPPPSTKIKIKKG